MYLCRRVEISSKSSSCRLLLHVTASSTINTYFSHMSSSIKKPEPLYEECPCEQCHVNSPPLRQHHCTIHRHLERQQTDIQIASLSTAMTRRTHATWPRGKTANTGQQDVRNDLGKQYSRQNDAWTGFGKFFYSPNVSPSTCCSPFWCLTVISQDEAEKNTMYASDDSSNASALLPLLVMTSRGLTSLSKHDNDDNDGTAHSSDDKSLGTLSLLLELCTWWSHGWWLQSWWCLRQP